MPHVFKKEYTLLNQDKLSVPFQDLNPDVVLGAVEACGYLCDGKFLALNSYENRVYQVGIEDGKPLVAKFYRPYRWSNETILEEHEFSRELVANEIPVVAPLQHEDGQTLHEFKGYRFALFPRQGGRWPDLDQRDNLIWMGRFIGRIHAVGAISRFKHRVTLTIEAFGNNPYQFLLESGIIPRELELSYRHVVEEALQAVETLYQRAGDVRYIRLHGDCHPGNVLWTDQGPHFVDLDDCCMGPAIQDMWMLFSGDRQEVSYQLSTFLEGYCAFYDFDPRQLHLIEALRTLRLINYSAWLAKRWSDPAFPRSFPWFNTHHYWNDQVQILREQILLMDEPPIEWLRLF